MLTSALDSVKLCSKKEYLLATFGLHRSDTSIRPDAFGSQLYGILHYAYFRTKVEHIIYLYVQNPHNCDKPAYVFDLLSFQQN